MYVGCVMELRNRVALSAIVSLVLTGLTSAYMVYVKVPAVVEIRPKITEVGLMTGLFGGRGTEYLYYHYPIVASLLVFVMIGLAVFTATLR